MIRDFERARPHIADTAYIDDSALVIGDVTIGEDASVWPTSVLRGDVNSITVGDRTNIQDGTVIHVTHDGPYSPGGIATIIGAGVTVGHRAVLHACTVEDYCLIGMGAIIMDGVLIQREVMVAAGSLVPPGKELESGYLYVGSPAKRLRALTAAEREQLHYSAEHYVKLKNRYSHAF
ncbi:gamma carbonic anhydrase family protein [Alkalilimnicola ehrlichii]|uniref:Gamma carbonic anhydrase family protein n=1 Tax=Alkalilimnicola ehrlichii TaxID=351052 RepID=A0A3E0X415_9GAMM|nr:gamma carbonic anhydrase family protein [Alkalilimnicola ehrlichii]RFA31123.1 gamma carbonic anhydrase family protein [Alkalilimnicola ehrlichii]RFA39590.1 gamma carbonic anhydrase family protein [Alkalilimnicola ehrlichii]